MTRALAFPMRLALIVVGSVAIHPFQFPVILAGANSFRCFPFNAFRTNATNAIKPIIENVPPLNVIRRLKVI